MIQSDGAASQFRSRFVFRLLSGVDSPLNLTQCYDERHHGKGQWTVPKNCVFRDVMSGKCVNNNPKQFADHPDKSIKGIALLYLPAEEILNEPDNIEESPKITETLQIHMVKLSLISKNWRVQSFMSCQPARSLFSVNAMVKELVDMNKSPQMILTVAPVWVIIKQMKNGFNA